MAPSRGSEVALSIYELPGTSALNAMTRLAGMGGAYHVGVEVYWLEWSFGWCESGSGVYMVFPGASTLGRYVERVPLGHTSLSAREVVKALEGMRQAWHGPEYDLLRQNCAHFSTELANMLLDADVPEWVNSLAHVGSRLVSALGKDGAAAAAERATPEVGMRLPPPMAQFDDSDVEEEAYGGNQDAMREMNWRRAVVYVAERAAAVGRSDRYVELVVEFRWACRPGGDAANARRLQGDLLQYESFRRAVVDATCLGMGREHSRHEDSDIEPSDDGGSLDADPRTPEVISLLWMRTWPGGGVRAKLRLQSASDDTRWPPEWPSHAVFAGSFENVMLRAVTTGSSEWPSGADALVRSIECTAAPGNPVFGDRVEFSDGTHRAILHASEPEPACGAAGLSSVRRLRNLMGTVAHRSHLHQSTAWS